MSFTCVDLSPPARRITISRPRCTEVHAVAWADVDPHLRHSLADRRAVTKVAGLGSVDACRDTPRRSDVAEPGEPRVERLRREDRWHGSLHICNYSSQGECSRHGARALVRRLGGAPEDPLQAHPYSLLVPDRCRCCAATAGRPRCDICARYTDGDLEKCRKIRPMCPHTHLSAACQSQLPSSGPRGRRFESCLSDTECRESTRNNVDWRPSPFTYRDQGAAVWLRAFRGQSTEDSDALVGNACKHGGQGAGNKTKTSWCLVDSQVVRAQGRQVASASPLEWLSEAAPTRRRSSCTRPRRVVAQRRAADRDLACVRSRPVVALAAGGQYYKRTEGDRRHSVWITRHGGPEVLAVRSTPDPEPGPGHVRVRVRASGLNFADIMARMGLYPALVRRGTS